MVAAATPAPLPACQSSRVSGSAGRGWAASDLRSADDAVDHMRVPQVGGAPAEADSSRTELFARAAGAGWPLSSRAADPERSVPGFSVPSLPSVRGFGGKAPS